MLTMFQIHGIREGYFSQHLSITEIAKAVGVDWKTAKKYIVKDDFNKPSPSSKKPRASKLDPFKPLIDSWIEGDERMKAKQRHTAKRVYDRLRDEVEGFNCSYRLVAAYFKKKVAELKRGDSKEKGYTRLNHDPGTAQADFGSVDFYENGIKREANYFVLSFPQSNGGYLQLTYGQNIECLLEGMKQIFEYIGGVPTEIWFDNASSMVKKIYKGEDRDLTERFMRFCEHYGFKSKFMNPASGNEKGNVENKVGYLRRNLCVPIPMFSDLDEQNAKLLPKCDKDMEREHYRDDDQRFISELFQADLAALHPLPSMPFETAGYVTVKTDKCGYFKLDEGKHEYSGSPDLACTKVNVRLTSKTVEVLDHSGNVVITHRRLYGDQKSKSVNLIPYITYISRHPRSLYNSGLYNILRPEIQKFLDTCTREDRNRVLRILAELNARDGFDSAMNTIVQAIKRNATDPDSIKALHMRLNDNVPQLPPLDISILGMPQQQIIPVGGDLAALDKALIRNGGNANG